MNARPWNSDAILKGKLENIPDAPSNTIKIYILSTKTGMDHVGITEQNIKYLYGQVVSSCMA